MKMFDNTWYFTAEELKNSPSYRHGMAAVSELLYRQITADQIQRMGRWLGVNQLTINSAIVYMHRFYMYHSFTKFHRNEIAAAALFLACKVENQPRLLKDIIKAQHACLGTNLSDPESQEYAELAENLLLCENILLQTIAFQTDVQHPHPHVIKLCQLLKTPRDISQAAYLLATNSLHLTSMCLQYKPQVVGCFCVQLAYRWANHPIPLSAGTNRYWYEAIDKSVTPILLNQMTKEFLDIYDRSETRLKAQLRLSEQELLTKAQNQQAEEQRSIGDISQKEVKLPPPKVPHKESPFDSGIESSVSSHSRFDVPITWCESRKEYVFTDKSEVVIDNLDGFVDEPLPSSQPVTSDIETSPNDINEERDFSEIHPLWTPERSSKRTVVDKVQLAQSQEARRHKMREMMPFLISEKATPEVSQIPQEETITLLASSMNDTSLLHPILEPEVSQSREAFPSIVVQSDKSNLRVPENEAHFTGSNSPTDPEPSFYLVDDFIEWNTCPTPPVQTNSGSIFSPDADSPNTQLHVQAPACFSRGKSDDRSCGPHRTTASTNKPFANTKLASQTLKRSSQTSPAYAEETHSKIESIIQRANKIRKTDKEHSGKVSTQEGTMIVRIDKSRLNMKKVMEITSRRCDQSCHNRFSYQ